MSGFPSHGSAILSIFWIKRSGALPASLVIWTLECWRRYCLGGRNNLTLSEPAAPKRRFHVAHIGDWHLAEVRRRREPQGRSGNGAERKCSHGSLPAAIGGIPENKCS